MTVTSVYQPITFTGDGASTNFPFTFPIYETSDIVVQTIVVATGVIATLAETTDYTVALNGTAPDAGAVTLLSPSTKFAVGMKLVISCGLPYTQESSLVDNQSVPAATYLNMFDRIVILCQQLLAKVNQSILQSPDTTTPLSLPAASTGKILGWNSAGAIVNIDPETGLVDTSVFNVKDYGAVGDAATDDTAAIQAAVTAAGTYGSIYFPRGTYFISDTITFPAYYGGRVYGIGRGSSIVQTNAAKNIFSMVSAYGYLFKIEDLYMQGGVKAITFNTNNVDMCELTIKRCIFYNQKR